MTRVKGFDKAKELLTRKASFQPLDVSPELRRRIRRVFGEELSPQAVVERIINEVRDKGDEALFHYTKILDGVQLESLEVNPEDIPAAYNTVDE